MRNDLKKSFLVAEGAGRRLSIIYNKKEENLAVYPKNAYFCNNGYCNHSY